MFPNADALWHGREGYSPDAPVNYDRGWEAAERAATTDLYIDTHCWVFSDRDFIELMGRLTRMGLVDSGSPPLSRPWWTGWSSVLSWSDWIRGCHVR